jgi:hypothetical protein
MFKHQSHEPSNMKLQTLTPLLRFREELATTRDSLSAVLVLGDCLWVASDESTSVERLTTHDGILFEDHKSFDLNKLISLPASGTEFDQEIDIEGMDYADSYLWLVGSHSVKRKNVERDDEGKDEKLIKKLSKTEKNGNRFLLARIPLVQTTDTSEPELVVKSRGSLGSKRLLQAASLRGDVSGNDLTKAIREANGGKGESHLIAFLDVPGKDNGFDIEGLAVSAGKVFLGLRGPVLRGWAVVLQLSLDTSNPIELRLKDFGDDGQPYRKHFLDLKGLGIRDLVVDGDDLLILAGPTMTLDGPVVVYRWTNAVNNKKETLVRGETLLQVFEVPLEDCEEHPEGMSLVSKDDPSSVLIVYDNPSLTRKVGTTSVTASVFRLT